MDLQPKEEEVLRKYLVGKKVLIVDPNASTRTGMYKIMNDLGAKAGQVILCNNIQSAHDEMRSKKPEMVIAEYDLGRSCGLELLQSQRASNPDVKKSLFLLVTGNTSQTAVARAAEEDVDGYILKPFTMDIIRKIIMTTAMQKLKPSDYYIKINEAKDLVEKGSLDDAEKLLEEALKLDPKPSLALSYLGQVHYLKKFIEESQTSYKQGLVFNKIHYKCLIGLYEILMADKKFAEAYEIVKRVSQYFPANPKRLADVLRLAIMNEKYEDVEKYYSIFCNIDERSDTLIKYICAALVVCGKYYLQTSNRSRALELFQKAGVTSAGRVNILKEIILALIEFKLGKEANSFLERFPMELHSGAEYNLLRFQVVNLTSNVGTTMALGNELMQKGFFNESLYEVMIERAMEGHNQRMADSFLAEAAVKYPTWEKKFKEAFARGKSNASTAAA